MIDAAIYAKRRKLLKDRVKSGLILFLGHEESPMNYTGNTYPFRQDSSFRYFFGLDTPSLAGVVDPESGKDTFFGDDISLEDIIWTGELPKIREMALSVGVKNIAPLSRLPEAIQGALKQGRKIHYLPAYRPETQVKLSSLLNQPLEDIKKNASLELIKAVVAQRSVKSPEEIEEMEKAQAVSHKMYIAAMQMTKPGLFEWDLVAALEGIATANGCLTAFPIILTMNVHVFHSHYHGNKLEKGRLLVIDAGAQSPAGYASDITRTFPVAGEYTAKQREIYEIVLNGQQKAIQAIEPGIKYKEIHLATARTMALGLKELGLMKGDIDEAVEAGAHALFFPHGLGHMIGLDVHDMEGLGEDFVGYDETVQRSKQFGLAYLRMARKLEPGFVLTVEPGIYFIPPLIDTWKKEKKLAAFINYDKVEGYRNFTGVRIEDNVLVTGEGSRVLGKLIPKTVKDVERTMAGK